MTEKKATKTTKIKIPPKTVKAKIKNKKPTDIIELNPKQKLFVLEYLKDFNATAAAIRSGYSKRSANNIGPANLLKPIIKAEINKQIEIFLGDTKELSMRVIKECQKIAFAKLDDFLDYDEEGVILKSSKSVDTSALESVSFDTTYSKQGTNIKKRIKQHDKIKALDILAKVTALYKETETPTIPLSITVNIVDNESE